MELWGKFGAWISSTQIIHGGNSLSFSRTWSWRKNLHVTAKVD